jgi:hypothetical protein
MILKTMDGVVLLGYLYSHPPYIVGTLRLMEHFVDFSSRDSMFSAEENGSRGSIFWSGKCDDY